MYKSPSRAAACALVLLALSAGVKALPDDQDQPIRIEAIEALRDENQGFTQYKGNVTLDQGSLHIEADILTVYHTGQDAQRITAHGKPATMRQQPEIDKAVITARANRIEYYRNEARVELRESASIEQEGSTVTGDRIDYFINEKLVKADSDRSNTSSRVQVVIPAQVIQAAEESSQAQEREAAADPNSPASAVEEVAPKETADGATGSP
ncbi:lipopolysaccharide transport periplasmic protein LptA [Haliea sp. E17]|uniref:lipopolysaccharide transport periplasmic protein LptA n=1 Tax=Haliea sp. E17 TaxID=3401576 RepID=UPI003AAB1AC4